MMMNRLRSMNPIFRAALIFAVAFLLFELVVPRDSKVNGLKWSILSNGDLEITSYTGKDAELMIPAEIDQHKVTHIGPNAFQGCAQLTSVTLPEDLKEIGNDAFEGCTGLTSLTLPEGLEKISSSAFKGCAGLTLFVTGGSYAERYCRENYLRDEFTPSFTILAPASTVPDGLAYAVLPEGGVEITRYTGTAADLEIPDLIEGQPVVRIADYAFQDCAALTSVTLPEGLASIGYGAFLRCARLANLTLPEGLTELGCGVFMGCASMADLTLPDSLTELKGSPIAGSEITLHCSPDHPTLALVDGLLIHRPTQTLLTFPAGYVGEFTVPDGIRAIGDYTFAGCPMLMGVILPQGLTTVGQSAFIGNSLLLNVTLPESLCTIGNWAFEGCSNLTFIVPEGSWAEKHCREKGLRYELSQSEPAEPEAAPTELVPTEAPAAQTFDGPDGLRCALLPEGGVEITRYTGAASELEIPDLIEGQPVVRIGQGAFEDSATLVKLTLPETITSIGDSAFAGCTGLTRLSLPGGLTALGENLFARCNDPILLVEMDSRTAQLCKRNGLSFVPIIRAQKQTEDERIPDGIVLLTLTDGTAAVASYNGDATELSLPAAFRGLPITRILSNAFAGNQTLTRLILPASITSIGMNAFHGCDGLTLVVEEGSWAEGYCREHGYRYETVGAGGM